MIRSNNGPLLHRDDPEKDPLVGNIKVTREDWINVATDVMISNGVDEVKVKALGERLGVSRSSFYWYFESRQQLLDTLLEHWQSVNTRAMIEMAAKPAPTITAAVCNVFRCAVNTELFNTRIDLTVRDWARKSGAVRRVMDQSDQMRLDALTDMFARYGYPPLEAETRARILYFMQIGYNAAELSEPIEDRLRRLPAYLLGFTGRKAKPGEIKEFNAYANKAMKTVQR